MNDAPVTPTTAAGRALLDYAEWRLPDGTTAIPRAIAVELIPRIEAEAAAAARAELLDVETLAACLNDAQMLPSEIRLGRDLTVIAARILAEISRRRP